MNGYKKLHNVGLEAPAEMLEIVAGWPDFDRLERELGFALASASADFPETLQWLGVLIAARLEQLASLPEPA